jgi:hypothetical protein
LRGTSRSKSTRSFGSSRRGASSLRANQPSAASASRSSNIGLPAWLEGDWYGDAPPPVGPSGSTCHTFCPAAARKSTKDRAAIPRSPMPSADGSAVGWRRMPLARRSSGPVVMPVYIMAQWSIFAMVRQDGSVSA